MTSTTLISAKKRLHKLATLCIMLIALPIAAQAQANTNEKQTKAITDGLSKTLTDGEQSVKTSPFIGQIYNKEYDVFIKMNLLNENINIPGQDVLGPVFGYIKKRTDSRIWAILGAEVKKNVAKLEIVNDYGSEDLDATLTVEADGTYTLRQGSGSTIKVAGKGKWIKLPKTLTFVKQ